MYQLYYFGLTLCWYKQELLSASGHMLWAWAIWRLLIKPGHWNDAEVKLTILNGVECSGLYVVKRLLSFQRWRWHFCVGGSLHAWLRCIALNCIGQVTQPFLHCGRIYWYVHIKKESMTNNYIHIAWWNIQSITIHDTLFSVVLHCPI